MLNRPITPGRPTVLARLRVPMKIKQVRIHNFRSLREAEIDFDTTTCFIGPTGAGKSTVLGALDWFFNGEKTLALDEQDLHSGAGCRRILVEVEFDQDAAAAGTG